MRRVVSNNRKKQSVTKVWIKLQLSLLNSSQIYCCKTHKNKGRMSLAREVRHRERKAEKETRIKYTKAELCIWFHTRIIWRAMHKVRGFHSYGVSTWSEVPFQRKPNLPNRREVEQLLCPPPHQCSTLASGMASQSSPLSHPSVHPTSGS